jgi:pyruvate dehydrogenase E2 component (dihydrolipoamide acetyltransferase)/2-oxoisovalerate dehydrogenase E2 component (dihydrolipoyl transacylase)
VRYLARKLGVDLGQIQGSGPGGRVLIEDLSAQVRPATAEAARPAEPKPDYGEPGTRVKLQGIRRTIAEHMVRAKHTIPHYSYVDECDVTELVRLRESLRETYARAGIKLTYLAFFVKAAVGALKAVPLVNASLDDAAGEIVLHDRYHIGIAVATPAGLLVPVVRDADRKDLGQIARDVERLSAEARAGRARREDLRGGTFTVTSIGNVGGLISTPVINHPEVAILGVGKVVKRPVFDAAGAVRPAEIVYLSLSFDHRVLDGAIGAAFGNALIRRLQNPATLLLPDNLP